jgi:hypothetical protein
MLACLLACLLVCLSEVNERSKEGINGHAQRLLNKTKDESKQKINRAK